MTNRKELERLAWRCRINATELLTASYLASMRGDHEEERRLAEKGLRVIATLVREANEERQGPQG